MASYSEEVQLQAFHCSQEDFVSLVGFLSGELGHGSVMLDVTHRGGRSINGVASLDEIRGLDELETARQFAIHCGNSQGVSAWLRFAHGVTPHRTARLHAPRQTDLEIMRFKILKELQKRRPWWWWFSTKWSKSVAYLLSALVAVVAVWAAVNGAWALCVLLGLASASTLVAAATVPTFQIGTFRYSRLFKIAGTVILAVVMAFLVPALSEVPGLVLPG